jgi:hypothetical protein
MIKVINPIRLEEGQVFIKIKYIDKKLSITGVVAPLYNGDAKGSCGQIQDELTRADRFFNNGWSAMMVDRLYTIWNTWHLNDINAGTPKQEAAIKEWLKQNNYDYLKACDYLKTINLYCDGQDVYGHKCYFVEVPTNIIEWLFELPTTERTPAWI